MAILSLLCWLYLFANQAFGLATPRLVERDDDLSVMMQSISAEMSSPTFIPYSQPSQNVVEFIALGDSYTAGTGSNGIYEDFAGDALRGQHAYPMQMASDAESWADINNGDDTLPRLSFHAYTGDLSMDLVKNQLHQGEYKDDKTLPRGQSFGKPQLAVLTIGGNDAKLSAILKDCIYRTWGHGNCQDTIASLQADIDSGKLRDEINFALYNVAHAGRQARGANQREEFQVFVLSYITFFNDQDTGCDMISWNVWRLWPWSKEKLTTSLRRQLNALTTAVNGEIRKAAHDLAGMGVFFVEGLEDIYNGHRYCEPGHTDANMVDYETWFWSPNAHFQTNSEGPGDPNTPYIASEIPDPAQTILDFVFGKDHVVSQASQDSPPWEWEGAEKYPTVEDLMAAMEQNDDVQVKAVPVNYLRTFHPKGTAYGFHAKRLFAAIAEQRGGSSPEDGEGDYTSPPTCNLDDSDLFLSRRETNQTFAPLPLQQRAPIELQPLQEPASISKEGFAEFINEISTKESTEEIPIHPTAAQTKKWKVKVNGKVIPVGATALGYTFEGESKDYSLGQLSGCTAILAVSSKGIYAGHLWQGSKSRNGASAFTETLKAKTKTNPKQWQLREPEEFRAVAVDIWGQPTPEEFQEERDHWESIIDNQNGPSGILNDGGDVEIWYMTLAKVAEDYPGKKYPKDSQYPKDAKYPDRIEELRNKFSELIPGSTDSVQLYREFDSRMDELVQGNMVIQYSPYDHDGGSDGRTPQARVRVFCEGRQEPVIDRSWDSQFASGTAGETGTSGSSPGNGPDSQQLAFATYIDPGANVATWNRIIKFPADKMSIVVANVVNGPDSAANGGWLDVIPRAAASGKTVLGYVRTGYLGVSFQQFTTRLGSSKTHDWVAQVQEDVDQWYRLYPDIGGIFFDEGWNDCGDNNVNAELYKFITQSTKRKYPGAYTILNPGAPMPKCFEHSADTLLTAEVSYAVYTSSAYAPSDWIPTDSRKIWHIVYDVPEDQVASVAALARQRGAGLLHITDDIEPNPYDTVPNDNYMQTMMDAVAGGTPFNEGTYAYPGGPSTSPPANFRLDSFDYSSATVSWSDSRDAMGYSISQNGERILELTPEMTTVTIGGLAPGSPYTFDIVALNGDGSSTAAGQEVAVDTLALSNAGQTVSHTSVSAGASQTTYKANILVPYAFVRVFIWDETCLRADGQYLTWRAWPIFYGSSGFVCTRYMVEGGYLYRYTSSDEGSDAQWRWQQVAEAPLVQDGYDYTWTVPIGTSTMDTSNYLVQVQGYGPMANVFHTNPCHDNIYGARVTTYCA